MKTTTILFDLDDTLVPEMAPEEESFRAACALAAGRFGADAGALHQAIERHAEEQWAGFEPCRYGDLIGMAWWEALWATFEGPGEELAALRAWAPSYRQQTWTRALADVGVHDAAFAAEISDVYQRERSQRHRPYEDAAGVLEDLKRDCRLGILTNGAPDVQRTKLAGSGLAPYFDALLVTGDIGIGKPDPKPFEVILDRLDASAETSVMVGNSLTSDVLGARNAGVRSIWLDLDGSWARPELGITPDVEIRTLGEIRRVLE